MNGRYEEGMYGIYKPKGITSYDVIRILKKITGISKIGHAGTLDPLAEGILVVGVGSSATKKLQSEVQKEKEYIARIYLGKTSTTDDEEGEKKENSIPHVPAFSEIENILPKFIGAVSQMPPVFSAIKIRGKEAYKYARKGEAIVMESRMVEIKSIEILSYEWPILMLRVVTGPGVYIRSLARDIGEEVQTGGYLAGLERVRVGDFTKENSFTLIEFEKEWGIMKE